jgi:adenosylmethionine-8-amino-7-oxononanoate aminotransferase
MADDLVRRDRASLIHSLHSAAEQDRAHVWVAGRGAVLVDDAGREFLDALSGLWNVIAGHGRAELAAAAARQMETLAYCTSYSGSTNRPAIELGERLAEMCYPGVRRFFFTSGGAEANETAFKTARYYWRRLGQSQKTAIIGRSYSYHGTTLAAMSATGLPAYWPMFEPRVPGFLHVESPYPYRFELGRPAAAGDSRTPGQRAADRIEEAILAAGPDTVAAVIGEPVQGAGGVIVPPEDYWPRVRQICDRHRVLLIADEVITGFGRTGAAFGLSRYGVEPDLMTFAKGVTSGYFPLGGVGMREAIAAAIDTAPDANKWMHAFTYSGHPTGCAVALANLELVEREGLVARAAELGTSLQRRLQSLASHPHVGEVRGLGLMAAVELVADRATRAEFPPGEQVGVRVHRAAQERGMFSRLRGDVFLLAPCFVTSEGQLEQMVQILGDAIEAVLGS